MKQMTHNEKIALAGAMKKYGGSFARALTECFLFADDENLERLCNAFPEYVEKYSRLAGLNLTARLDLISTKKEPTGAIYVMPEEKIGG